MMKKLKLKILLAILTTCSVLFVKPQSSLAQVNMRLLTEVAKSCQTDVSSPEYYSKMGINFSEKGYNSNPPIGLCIYSRYFHSLVLSKLPWLASTNEILPGYPGTAAVSLQGLPRSQGLLDCIVSQGGTSQECKRFGFGAFAPDRLQMKIQDMAASNLTEQTGSYVYICPSCMVVRDEILLPDTMMDAFIKWFLSLDKPKRREIMSILGDEQDQVATRDNIRNEAWRAVQEYQEIRQRVEQQDREQRKREVLGN